jgi:death-on-curing protein|tara:strand:- start:27130 stop:27525 length:396 start_codon:yes stop_codon:yes gene_type:complete
MSAETNWITPDITLALHDRQLAEHGGQAGLRDESLLLSALARPQQLLAYGDPSPDLCAMAAAYAYGIAKNHPFLDGNKRTAFVVYRLFLKWNGIELNAEKSERYATMLALAAGEMTEENFTTWLRENTAPI